MCLPQTSSAPGIQARTLEVFENMGVIDQVLAAGTKAVGLTVYDGDRVVLRLSPRHIRDSQYPFLLILPQSQTESILNERLAELGGDVERSRR